MNAYFANEQHVSALQEGQTNHERAIQVKRFNSIGPKTKTNHKKTKEKNKTKSWAHKLHLIELNNFNDCLWIPFIKEVNILGIKKG